MDKRKFENKVSTWKPSRIFKLPDIYLILLPEKTKRLSNYNFIRT